MGLRRKGREYALQMLFAMDITGYMPDQIFAGYHAIQDLSQDAFLQAQRLVEGVHERMEDIDLLLSGYAKNWKIPRMAVVDRNLLRLSIFELKYLPDIHHTAILKEALEICVDFSEDESYQFIKGILDTASRELRPNENAKRLPKTNPVNTPEEETESEPEPKPDTEQRST